MPSVTTAQLHLSNRALFGDLLITGSGSYWWFCGLAVRELWHIPKRATKFWLKASTSKLPGSYEIELARFPEAVFRLAGEKHWRALDEEIACGVEMAFKRLGVTEDKPKTVWVQLLYE